MGVGLLDIPTHHSGFPLTVQLCLRYSGFLAKKTDDDRRVGELRHAKNLIILKREGELVVVLPRESM